MSLSFSYAAPAVSRSGAQATYEPLLAETCMSTDYNLAGKIALQIPGGFPGDGTPRIQRVRTAGTRVPYGIVLYNPGKPAEPEMPTYVEGEEIPVARKGRIWIYCENYSVDPALANLALFFMRDSGGTGEAPEGNLRYGNNDTATCTALPAGLITKVFDARALAGGAALLHVEIDF